MQDRRHRVHVSTLSDPWACSGSRLALHLPPTFRAAFSTLRKALGGSERIAVLVSQSCVPLQAEQDPRPLEGRRGVHVHLLFSL